MAQYSTSRSSNLRPPISANMPQVFSPNQRPSVSGPQLSSLFDERINDRKLPRLSNGSDKRVNFLPPVLALLLGSKYFLIVLCITLIVPILELAIGIAYRDQCPVNSSIPIYLIVAGACGLAVVGLAIMIVAAFVCCVKQNSIAGSLIGGCGIGIVVIIIVLTSVFSFAWFIVGNVWVFGAKNKVHFDREQSSNYCRSILYNFAFWIIILTYVMIAVSCFVSCCRACFRSVTTLKA